MKETKLKKQSKINPSDYVNIDTGELLSSEANNKVSITIKESSGLFSISSDEYVTFDSKAMAYICSQLNKADIARVFRMSNMVKGNCSVLYQGNNFPHTTETLSAELSISEHEFYAVVRRLVRANVLAYTICAPSGFTQKIYMLNPYISRKRKQLNCELKEFFRDVTINHIK